LKAQKIKNILSSYFENTKYIETKEILNIEKLWKNVAGKTIAKNTEIFSFKRGKLRIKTTNSIWRNELIFQKEDLLQRLKEHEPQLKIKEIEFR
tara:strand:- start:742 stop:1023 length:282 start_codon:yes stop_codon:yes gene_type:complete